ncbi:major facilitator superfamily domain-containing protein [Aspergillus tamarii]|uniref:Major facilitator superfamily domain-containing protein n=1 Tax=Aspergillus tamarii TaxID=41984 RepID=A0A5N6UDQ9_ASPTM|nr:major facilitator superfamily domain-containing protein [Aspergillus tamarii]
MAMKSEERYDIELAKDYSVFTVLQKRAIIFSDLFIGLLLYINSSIFYPAVNQISADLYISSTKINLTVTITQGIVSMIIAEFSGKAGRRSVYTICFFISIVANLGLALQNNYFALLFLRILQSAESCGILTSAERGKYFAYVSIPMIFGPSLSPILGGLISQYAGWHWIFWFLLIFFIIIFVSLALFLPEIYRQVVNNTSILLPGICSNISDLISFKNRLSKNIPIDQKRQVVFHRSYRLTLPNPISILCILADFESALILVTLSFDKAICSMPTVRLSSNTFLAMSCYYAVLTNISKTFYGLYGFSNTQISLVALSVGGGSIVTTFTTGRLMNWNYRRHATKLNFPLSKIDLSGFPIEQARLEIGLPPMLLEAIGVLGYGWTLRNDISVAVPIIFLFIVGYGITSISQVLYVLMADIYPGQFAVAAAARNVCQCLVGAATSAAIEPMCILFMLSLIGSWATVKHGMEWRKAKREKPIKRSQKNKNVHTKGAYEFVHNVEQI